MQVEHSKGFATIRRAVKSARGCAVALGCMTLLALPRVAHGFAIAALQNINLQGSGNTIDSFDSADPDYCTNGQYDPNKRKAGGDVACVSGIVGVANAHIYGKLRTGPNGTYAISPGGIVGDLNWTNRGIESGWYDNTLNVTFPDVPPPYDPATALAPIPFISNSSIIYILGSARYAMSSLTLDAGDQMNIVGNATLYVTGDVNMRSAGPNTSSINVSPGASLKLYVGGASTTFQQVNTAGSASTFQCFGLPTNTSLSWGLSVGGQFVGTIYAPEATVSLGGGGNSTNAFIGAVVANSVVLNGRFNFHFDENLNRVGPMPPTIVTNPQGQSVVVGQDKAFSVTATGPAPLSYQWRLNGTNLDTATNATLVLTNVTTDQAGGYSVTVSNSAGRTASDVAVLTVYTTAATTLETVWCGGGQFQFSVNIVPGLNYAIEASTNLTDWVLMSTNTAPFTITDMVELTLSERFYRAVYLP